MNQYLCLGYYTPEAFDRMTDEDRQTLAQQCEPHNVALHETGRPVSVASLEHGTHVSIRPGEGGPSITDGPYVESKEIVGSFFIIEADDLDDAVRVASLHPAAQLGAEFGFAIEVRPIEYFVGR